MEAQKQSVKGLPKTQSAYVIAVTPGEAGRTPATQGNNELCIAKTATLPGFYKPMTSSEHRLTRPKALSTAYVGMLRIILHIQIEANK